MIPKIIHYCWFGNNPLPQEAIKCIESWKRFFPSYEIKQWNETNFNVNIIPYTEEAYKAKKYAFVSDFARFWIIYNYGGLYFDTDVEIIKPMDKILQEGAFMGCESDFNSPKGIRVAAGLGICCESKHKIYKELINLYQDLHFIENNNINTTTVVEYTTRILINNGLKNIAGIQDIAGIKIYPKEFFCPIDYSTNKLLITSNTYSIHHYAASWHGPKEKLYRIVRKFLGEKFTHAFTLLYKKITQW